MQTERNCYALKSICKQQIRTLQYKVLIKASLNSQLDLKFKLKVLNKLSSLQQLGEECTCQWVSPTMMFLFLTLHCERVHLCLVLLQPL